MQLKAPKINASYRLLFSRPALELLSNAARIMESLVKSIATQFPIQSQDLRIANSVVAGEVSVSLQIFGGNGRIKISVDSIEADFDNISGRNDVQIVTNALDLMAKGVGPFFADVPVSREQLSTNIIYKVEGGKSAILQYFSRVVVPGKLEAFTDRGIKLTKRDGSRALLQVSVEPYWSDEESILLYISHELSSSVRKSTFPEKIKEYETVASNTFSELDLTVLAEGG